MRRCPNCDCDQYTEVNTIDYADMIIHELECPVCMTIYDDVEYIDEDEDDDERW